MFCRLLSKYALPICFSISVALLGAAEKKLPIDETSNDVLAISVSQPLDREQIKQEVGADWGENIIAIRLTARPVSEKPVKLNLDDFLLISGKDGQRSMPYEAGQLAGSDSLAVTDNGVRRGLGDHRPRPSIGFGGIGIGAGGSGASSASTPNTRMEESHGDKENPLLAALNAKILPEKEITEPVTGLLFFQIAGKVKPKDLELHYKGPAGTMALRFRPEK